MSVYLPYLLVRFLTILIPITKFDILYNLISFLSPSYIVMLRYSTISQILKAKQSTALIMNIDTFILIYDKYSEFDVQTIILKKLLTS